jgi:hypothetical protein
MSTVFIFFCLSHYGQDMTRSAFIVMTSELVPPRGVDRTRDMLWRHKFATVAIFHGEIELYDEMGSVSYLSAQFVAEGNLYVTRKS